MFTRVPIMKNEECREWLDDERRRMKAIGSSNVPPVVPIEKNQLCTGMKEAGSGGCHGDSGSIENTDTNN